MPVLFETGRWSPAPAQVVAIMIPATALPGDLWNPSVALPMLVAAIVGALFAGVYCAVVILLPVECR